MNKIILSIVATLLLATPALADISPEEMFQGAYENLLRTVASEKSSLEEVEELEKAEKKALKAFAKVEKMAAKLAEKYGELGTDKKSLKKVGKIVKTIEKVTDTEAQVDSKSVGLLLPAVQSAMSELISAMRYIVSDAGSYAEEKQDELDLEKNFLKIGKQLDKASTKSDAAEMYWASYAKWAKAWANYIKAVTTYAKAAIIAGKLHEKELKNAGTPSGLKFDADGKLINNTGEEVLLKDLIYDLTIKVPNVPASSVSFKLSDSASAGELPISLGTLAFDPALYSGIWNNLSVIPGVSVKGKIVYVTTVGNLTFNFK